jgi:type II secretory ATPase GspE/PulE/Tfp pilus assembly ATPase PilB-like protein
MAEREAFRPQPGDDPQAIVRISHTIIQQAIQDHASEITVEPRAADVTVLFRVNGVIEEKMKLPAALRGPLIARYKQMADMDLDRQDPPQQGRIAISMAGRDYDLDARSEPAPTGERIVLVIHEKP